MPAVLALVLVTAVWGVTFVQVKDAVALYPLFAFLAVRFWIATLTLAVPGLPRVRSLGRPGFVGGAFLGLLLAAGYTLQTAGLERTTVSSTGFITGMYVVLTPLIALVLVRSRIGLSVWGGVALSTIGLAMLSGIHAGSVTGDLLVLAAAAVYSLQIVLMERYAPRYDAVAFTFVEMLAAGVALGVVAAALGDLHAAPRLDGLGRAARHRRLRERARLSRADLGAAANVGDPHRSCLHDGAGLDRVLRLHPRRRPARVAGVGRLRRDHGRHRPGRARRGRGIGA